MIVLFSNQNVFLSFLQTIFACSYWTCCMHTITFERKGDEDHEDFFVWGGNPDHLDARNSAIQAYKLGMTSFFQHSKKHSDETSCWIIVNNNVYDVTNFLKDHPPSKKIIIKKAGTDCSYDLHFHSDNAKKILKKFIIDMFI